MKYLHPILILSLAIHFGIVTGQSRQSDNSNNFYSSIKNYDLSCLWTADSILAEDREGGRQKIKRFEPLGYIDTNYQRFFIRIISVTRKKDNPYEYFVSGKTKIKDNICSFQGTIKVSNADTGRTEEFPLLKVGAVTCEVLFSEDKNLPNSGIIQGKLTSYFIIDWKGKMRYDAIMYVADNFYNNQFKGTWTSYKTKTSIICNWGDYCQPAGKSPIILEALSYPNCNLRSEKPHQKTTPKFNSLQHQKQLGLCIY